MTYELPSLKLYPEKIDGDERDYEEEVGNINLLNGPRENNYFNFILEQQKKRFVAIMLDRSKKRDDWPNVINLALLFRHAWIPKHSISLLFIQRNIRPIPKLVFPGTSHLIIV